MISAHFINDLYQMSLPPFLPLLISTFNLSYYSAGSLISISLLMAFIASLIAGHLADIGGRRKQILVTGYTLYGISMVLLGSSFNILSLILAIAILGIAQGMYHPQAFSFINFFIKGGIGRAMGIHGIGGSIGHASAPIIIGFLIVTWGWRNGSFLLIIPAIIMVLILLRFLHNPPQFTSSKSIKNITLPLLLVILLASMRSIVYRGFVSFLPSFFVYEGNTILQAGILTALMLIIGIIAQPLGGSISDKIGRKKVFLLASLLLTISLVGFIFSTGLFRLFFLPLIGLSIFVTFPVTFVWTSELIGMKRTGISLGLMFGTSSVVGSISPIFLGYFIDLWGFIQSFYLLPIFSVIAIIATLIIPETKKIK